MNETYNWQPPSPEPSNKGSLALVALLALVVILTAFIIFDKVTDESSREPQRSPVLERHIETMRRDFYKDADLICSDVDFALAYISIADADSVQKEALRIVIEEEC